jgi:hypothetical protein
VQESGKVRTHYEREHVRTCAEYMNGTQARSPNANMKPKSEECILT